MDSPHPRFTSAKLIEIDDAVSKFDPVLDQFSHAHGFTFWRGDGNTPHTPRRSLRRRLSEVVHCIDLYSPLPIFEKLERGFYADIPFNLLISAQNPKCDRVYREFIIDAQPFSALNDLLAQSLAEAVAKLDAGTADFVD